MPGGGLCGALDWLEMGSLEMGKCGQVLQPSIHSSNENQT